MQLTTIKEYIGHCIQQSDYNQLAKLQCYIPQKSIQDYKLRNKGKIRDRVFSIETTLLGMLIQAGQEDKSKQNAVTILGKLHEERKKQIQDDREKLVQTTQQELERQKSQGLKKMGRPRKRYLVVAKSKEKQLSIHPSSYDEATIRYPEELIRATFSETTQWFKDNNTAGKGWKGRAVYAVDGTTFKTQDTEQLREYFDCDRKKNNQPLPIGRLEGLINLYGGGLVAVDIDKYTSSEGKMLKKIFNQIPEGTIVLADDLYSKYGYFSYCKQHKIDLITQKKCNNQEETVREIIPGDKIVKWKKSTYSESVLYNDRNEMEEFIILRKIQVIDPADPKQNITIYTTLLDETAYPALDIITLYFQRWEIEISFRQIKSILKMEYLRGKTVDMVHKEIYAHLILYNIIRKMLSEDNESTSGTFPPSCHPIQTGASVAKGAYVDKLGRSYSRWNAGRYKTNTKN